MPFYNFKCINDKCDYQKDELVKMGENTIICPDCGNEAKKTNNSYRFVSTNLPNGHHALRSKK